MEALRGPIKFVLAICLGLLCTAMAYELGWQRGQQVAELGRPAPEWTTSQPPISSRGEGRRHGHETQGADVSDRFVTPASARRR